MDQVRKRHVPLHAPNIINVCVDENVDGEMAGRVYHCYDKEPWGFINVVRLIESVEDFFDRIAFPQAATKIRTFTKSERKQNEVLEKVVTPEELAAHRGKIKTFLIHVKSRQNSTWQGEVECAEEGNVQQFVSVLELLKILNNTLL